MPLKKRIAAIPVRVQSAFDQFTSSESSSGVILITTIVIALVIANSGLQIPYQQFLSHPLFLEHQQHTMTVRDWINDGLMAFFFLGVGMEIKREMTDGELANDGLGILPFVGALGGMAIPALIFLLFNASNEFNHGWAIPTATDIAFSLGILSLLGNRVVRSLRIFVTSLAIIDDLGAIIIIALFYSSHIDLKYLFVSLLLIGLLFLCKRYKQLPLLLYGVIGAVLWYALLEGGVHPTIAGVAVGMLIPHSVGAARFEKVLNSIVAIAIVPIFALANAAVTIDLHSISQLLLSPLSLGIIFGLFIGKPLGIYLFSFFTIKLGKAKLPTGLNNNMLLGASMLCGIGFTMSLFINQLAFASTPETIEAAKAAILCGSMLSGVFGYLYLKYQKS